MTLPACVVVAGVTTAIIANQHADDLVVDDYYKDGLAINRQLEKQQRATDLGITATLAIVGSSIAVDLSGPVKDPSLQLLLSHPLEADRDFTVTLARVSDGRYQGELGDNEVAAHWHWILKGRADDAWRVDGVLNSNQISNAPNR
jgi:hypothetical protein